MDWPRARAILLFAFLTVNLILAYSIWGPTAAFSGSYEAPYDQRIDQVRATLSDRGLILPSTVSVPKTPQPMQFLHVEYKRPTLELPDWLAEVSGKGNTMPNQDKNNSEAKPVIERDTQALVYRLMAKGLASQEVRLDNRRQVEQAAQQYLQETALMPPRASLSGVFPVADSRNLIVEYVPTFDVYPVFSGYVRVEVSNRGIESVKEFWVQPSGYTNAPAKAVRPATEALLRLAGRLESAKSGRYTVTDIRLGYYASRSFTALQIDAINGWDTVPVWRITLDNGEVYYINAFNGELES